jgi:subtilisin-like proprotein convertase family protein
MSNFLQPSIFTTKFFSTKFYIQSVFILLLGLISLKSSTQIITGVNPAIYFEGNPPVILYPNFMLNGGVNLGGGYILYDITNGNAQDQLAIFNDANPNALNAISVTGTSVFIGTGSGTNIIGTIDPVQNGVNGQDLRINFISNFINSGFESGLMGWTAVNQQVDLGVTSILGFTTPNDPTNPGNAINGDSNIPFSATYNNQISTYASQGTQSLRLFSDMDTRFGCDVVHGPYAHSSTFTANAGDVLTFDWSAINGGDWYDVFGYLLNTTTGASTITLNATGASTGWTTASVTVPTTGTYAFVFVSGTYDASCGQVAGASLYIDNFVVTNNLVNSSILSLLGAHITYSNLCGISDDTRNITVSVVNGLGVPTMASSTIEIVTSSPTISCPANTILNSPAGQCGAVATYNATATDDCLLGITYSIPSGSTFPVGITTVLATATDTYGNSSVCNFTITVRDVTLPEFTNCPVSNVPLDVFVNDCVTSVFWNVPNASDNCGNVNITQVSGIAQGSTQSPGIYPVSYVVSDDAVPANTATCSFNISVIDTENPVIQCPSQSVFTVVSTDPDECDYTVTTTNLDATIVENCPGITLINNFNNSSTLVGATFPIGNTTVVWTATDASGNISTCSFVMTVEDNQVPEITCPADIAVVNDLGVCGAIVIYDAPVVDDNCGLMLSNNNPNILFVSDNGNITEIPAALAAEGYNVTTVLNDYMGDTNPALNGNLSQYSVVIWHAVGDGSGDVHNATTTANLESYVQSGGNLFLTGYDVLGSPSDNNLAILCGGTTGSDFDGDGNLTVLGPGNSLTTGLFNIVGTTIYSVGDWDDLNGLTSETVNVVGDTRWSLRTTAGGGQVAFVSTDNFGSNSFVQWNTPGSGYYEALRNFTSNNSISLGTNMIIQTAGLASGSVFPVGITTNTFLITDNAGNTASCSFDVTITDDEDPMINCTGLALVTTTSADGDLGDCSFQYEWQHPVPTDNCAILSYTVSYVNPDGTTEGPNNIYQGSSKTPISEVNRDFEVGVTTVTYFVEDIHGNTTTCSFTVTVTDNETPIFANCPPAGFTVDVFTNDCIRDLTWNIPVATDNCSMTVTQTAGPMYGSQQGPGTYNIVYTATDNATPANTATCSFTINVVDTENPIILNCPYNDQEIFVDDDCEVLLPNYTTTINVNDNCGTYTTTQSPLAGSGPYAAGDVLTVIITVTDLLGNASNCTFDVNVLDTISPEITCLADIAVVNDLGVCGAVVTYADPAVMDNCSLSGASSAPIEMIINGDFETGDLSSWTTSGLGGSSCTGPDWVTYTGSTVPGQCWSGLDLTPSSGTYASYTGFDGSGPVTYYMQQSITLPLDIVSANLSWLETYQFLMGTFGGSTINRTLSFDLYDATGMTFIANLTSKDFLAGMDVNSGWVPSNSDVTSILQTYEGQTLTFRVSAYVPQNFTGPADYSIDNISLLITSQNAIMQIAGLPSGSIFPVGTTTNTFVVTDGSGNTTSCSFDVTVSDTQLPALVCPSNVVITTSNLGTTGDCEGQHSWSTPIPVENCTVTNYTVVYTNPDGSIDGPYPAFVYSTQNYPNGNGITMNNRQFELGVSTVTYYVEDQAGNTATCSFTVTVTDDEAPTFVNCPPAGFTVDVFTNDCVAGLFWNIPVATDNCSVIVTQTGGVAYGSIQGPGVYPIQYTATDGAGLTAVCNFTINVIDTENPVILCPSQSVFTVVSTDADECDYTVTTTNLDATIVENCPGITLINNFNNSSTLVGATFPIGNTTVVWTATDASGNTSTCSFVMTVEDNQAPEITCPANIVKVNDQGVCGAIVIYDAPVVDDNCGLMLSNNNPNILFVSDNGNITEIPAALAAEGYNVTTVLNDYMGDTNPALNGNLSQYSVVIWHAVGDGFGDVHNATTTANLESYVQSGGNLFLTGYDVLGSPSDNNLAILCGGTTGSDFDGDGNLTVLGPGNSLTTGLFNIVGTTIYSVGDWDDLNGLTSETINVVGDTRWSLRTTAGGGQVAFVSTDNFGSNSFVQWNTPGSGYYEALRNFTSNNSISLGTNMIIQTAGLASGSVFPVGITTNTFLITDNAGNTASCSFDVTITDDEDPMINCTGLALVTTTSADGDLGDCSFQYEWQHPVPTDNCAILSYTVSYVNPDGTTEGPNNIYQGSSKTPISEVNRDFEVGVTTVTYFVEDTYGNTTSCSFNVTVTDIETPIFVNCPEGTTFTIGADANCQNGVIWGIPVAEDNCGTVTVTETTIGGPRHGTQLVPGTYSIQYTATDGATPPNTNVCNFTIIVVDDDAPYLVCQSNKTVGTDEDMCSWESINNELNPLLVRDNCPGDILEYDIVFANGTQNSGLGNVPGGTIFSLGVNTITYTLTDAAGTIRTCSFNITVFDSQSPEITCPADLTIECVGLNNNTLITNWIGTTIATDNCPGVVSIVASIFSKNSQCGNTETILYRFVATDLAGNTSECFANVVTVDTIPPVIVGGANVNMQECTIQTIGNYPDFDFWLTNHAGATATDACGQVTWSNNYNPANWIDQCGNTRFVDVTFFARDNCGNGSNIVRRFSIGDITPPVFVNCPRPPVIVDAPLGWCSSYVNFSQITATDNCSSVTINQIDSSGLISGSLFPVGLTVLIFEAVDQCGNRDTCQLKIIVNDFHTPPSILCPSDTVTVNDLDMCGAVVDGLALVSVDDNCPDNLAVTYVVRDTLGTVLQTGIEDVSGLMFDVGKNNVTYTLSDQPILLITEVLQNGVISGVEIGNFGPASYDISCLTIRRLSSGITEDFVVPNGTIVGVGEVYTHAFSLIPAGQTATYSLHFINRIIDAITINSGLLVGDNIFRHTVFDTDTQIDFKVANVCFEGSYGIWNPQLPIFADNGTTTSLQSEDPSESSCTFMVTVLDIEAPACSMHDTLSFTQSNLPIPAGMCLSSTVNVGVGIVSDVNIVDLAISIANAGAVQAYLTSPSGTRILLFSDLCNGSANVDVTLDDQATLGIQSAPCAPLGNGGSYKPFQPFKMFFGEPSAGQWTLDVYLDNNATGTVTNWTLEVLNAVPYTQDDVVLNNDLGLCSASFTWTHPVFDDNCCNGTMTVTYIFVNDVTGVSTEVTESILSPNGVIDLDGTIVTRVFEVGVTSVIYTLIDQYGNESECGFTVTVNDDEAPTFPFGCADRTIYLAPGECYGGLTIEPIPADNCGVQSVQYCDESGAPLDVSQIPAGINVIVVKVTDIYGNIGTCSFIFNAVEFIPSDNTLACNNEINLSLGSDCTATISPDMILEGGPYSCYEDYCITITDLNGNTHLNLFTIDDVGKRFIVTISDCSNSNNSCWGYVNIENKLIPSIECPLDVTLACSEDPLRRFATGSPLQGQLVTGEVKVISCVPGAVITFVDYIDNNGSCSNPRAVLTRRWSVRSLDGFVSTCDQTITFEAFDVNSLVFPDNFILNSSLSCSDVAEDPSLTSPEHTGFPTMNGSPIIGKHYCDINIGYNDQILVDANCASAYEILRYWFVRNECAPLMSGVNPIIHIQSIKVDDNDAPILPNFVDITISTNPWSCSGNLKLPLFEISDNCSAYDLKWNIPYGEIRDSFIRFIPKGISKITVKATDICGNISRSSFNVTVVDKTPPIVLAKQDIVISLVPGYEADGSLNGQAKMFPGSIDNGSFDNCSDVKLEIRRPDGAPACGNDGNITNPATSARHNNNVTFSNSPLPGFNNNINDTDGGAFVKFCCADIPAGETFGIVQVELRVWDDGNMNGIIGDAGDNYNVTWANVRVEYKVPPQITCPPDMTIYCDWAIDQNPGTSDASAKSIEGFDFTKTGLPTAVSVCGTSDIRFWDRVQVNQCKIGTITRTFLVGTSGVKCVQTIKVDPSLASQPWTFIPSSLSETPIEIQSCDGPTAAQIAANAPRYTSGPCDNIGVSTDVKQFDFEQGVCRKWRVEFIYDNWCTDEKRGPFYKYFVYNDVVAPELECEDKMFPVDNDCVAQVVLNKTAIDTSGCIQTGWLKWEVYVDLWADGTNDYLFTSFYAGADGAVRIIDGDAVRQYKLSGPTTNAGSDGATQSGQELRITLPDLIEGSMSNHKVVWKVTDGCHNYTSCHENFMVADKKKPTPVCVPLSTALMADPDGNGPFLPMVELWAVDFMNKAYDNCTEDDKLLYTFDNVAPQVENKTVFGRVINIDVPHYFNAASGGVCAYPAISASEIAIRNQYLRGENGLQLWLPVSNSSAKVWTSTSLDPASPDGYTNVDVLVTVWDKKFNSDFCYASLKLALHETTPGSGSVSGNVETSEGKGVRNVTILIDSNQPEYPISSVSSSDGTFEVNYLKEGLNYELVAVKDGVYSEGVTTLDLVLIQRHILGIQTFTDNYKMIAADANNDGIVTASDLVELRKLILGLTSKLPNNKSWRFAVKDAQVEVDPLSFEERIIVNQLIGTLSGQDFIAVKIGDVNGNASTDVTNPTVESRSNNDVNLTIAERSVEAGETVAIPVTAANFNEVFGYQFTMNLNGASFVGVESGAIDMSIENIGVLPNDVITMSFASNTAVSKKGDDVLFTLIVKANKAGNVSEMMTLNSDVTATESYVGADLTVGKVSLNVRTADVAEAIELFQNEPNPFKGQTTVSFHMPSAAKASLSIYDVTGKLVTVRNIDAVKGYNSEIFTTAQLGTSGVLYYTLVSGDFTATKKMIIVE